MANILNWRDQIKFSSGDTVRVHQTVREGGKSRTQVFEGIVMRIRGHKGLKTFTVRKIATGGIGVERIFPEETPTVTKIEVVKKGRVRRANLSYLRDRVGKKATRVKDKFVKVTSAEVESEPEELSEEEAKEREMIAKKVEKVVKKTKAEKIASGVVKEKKASKKKKKIERKERTFVR
jgi:large subunit ribosomal protein L19